METSSEREITKIFKIGVLIKSIQGALEIIAGIFLMFVSTDSIINYIKEFAHEELVENSHDMMSIFLSYVSHHIFLSGTYFLIIYLLSHGLIKLFLIIGLIHKKLWAYYSFIIILSFFTIYEIYRYSITYSLPLLIFLSFDILFIYFTWMEAKILKLHLKTLK